MEIPLQTYLMITWPAIKIIIWLVYRSICNSRYSDKCIIISWEQMQEIYNCHYYTAYNKKFNLTSSLNHVWEISFPYKLPSKGRTHCFPKRVGYYSIGFKEKNPRSEWIIYWESVTKLIFLIWVLGGIILWNWSRYSELT